MSNSWSDEELEASVRAYFEMYDSYLDQIPFNKKDCYRKLHERFGRSEKAFEYRMQNISYVVVLEGIDYLPGLKPARNVGKNIFQQLKSLIHKKVFTYPNPISTETLYAEDSNKKAEATQSIPQGVIKPTTIPNTGSRYVRNGGVSEWVRRSTNGKCENCNQLGPFKNKDGQFFLEAHHVKWLSNGGSDTTSNCIAVCPNCHRAFHHSKDAELLVEKIYKKITRLERE
ncbi:HNH endonuclease [Budviciaceae bacterium BWR-B9]|uniref:HNH endonuclease n=1 Tax=Limnobaculum allomyrinae TaxID=2791986 RepID=A0ABS1INS1_9GAMM|nr:MULTISPECIES: HNH endonuclease [Limnobaculum]MBK5143406.1 HNH endonuclease [Limnobaculum allomyrinae]